MSPPKIVWGVLISIVLLSPIGFIEWQKQVAENNKPLPVFQQVPSFTLEDGNKKPIGLDDLKGKIWVAQFFFSRCVGVCPVTTAHLAQIHRAYVLEKDIQLVSITVDPDNDQGEKLLEYAKKFQANPNKWYFLSGDISDIQKLSEKGFRLAASKENMLDHSKRFVLVDTDAMIRGYYDGMKQKSMDQLFRDIAKLMREKK